MSDKLKRILMRYWRKQIDLFFDEADALVSTRVAKVETAHDRFVNMETNFLLQQLERYEGLVIMATNLEPRLMRHSSGALPITCSSRFPSRPTASASGAR
jgi:SpoVK/Ycf46/Vps4 family AAA+-type ATPase